MKLWQLTIHDPEVGLATWYFTSKADGLNAWSRLRKAAKEDDQSLISHGLTQVEVPTKRADLIKWLNMNAVTQDGYGDLWSAFYVKGR